MVPPLSPSARRLAGDIDRLSAPCYLGAVRSPLRLLLASGSLLTALTIGAVARAEPTAWVFVGGGALGLREGGANAAGTAALRQSPYAPLRSLGQLPTGRDFGLDGVMTVDVGVGSSPEGKLIFGGLFRFQPVFNGGVDLALLARAATHGFQAGNFGVALDAGGYARFWGVQSFGFAGDVTVGFPLGFQLTIQTTAGGSGALSVGAVAGVDLLRLTLYRTALLDSFPNPSSPVRRPSEPARAALSF